jgi:hypothetical protein
MAVRTFHLHIYTPPETVARYNTKFSSGDEQWTENDNEAATKNAEPEQRSNRAPLAEISAP